MVLPARSHACSVLPSSMVRAVVISRAPTAWALSRNTCPTGPSVSSANPGPSTSSSGTASRRRPHAGLRAGGARQDAAAAGRRRTGPAVARGERGRGARPYPRHAQQCRADRAAHAGHGTLPPVMAWPTRIAVRIDGAGMGSPLAAVLASRSSSPSPQHQGGVHARLCASPSPRPRPWPMNGGVRWAASPSRSTRPRRHRSRDARPERVRGAAHHRPAPRAEAAQPRRGEPQCPPGRRPSRRRASGTPSGSGRR